MIAIHNLTKQFGRLRALDGIEAEFSAGQSIALIGPNGSGKTTLLKCLLGMARPDTGSLQFEGADLTRSDAYRARIGYMPQIGRYPDNMRIGQLFDMMRDLRGYPENVDEELLDEFGLKTMFDKPLRALSGGTRQKVSAALAFLFHPAVLILDEPTAGLDPLAAEVLKAKILRERNTDRVIIVTSHILSDLDDISTHVMYLMDGKLQFFKDIETLKTETGETRLGLAIANVMRRHANENQASA